MHISVLICLFNLLVSEWGESVLSFVIVYTSTSSHYSAKFSFINPKISSYVSRPLMLFNNHWFTYLCLQKWIVIFGIICLFEPSLYIENDFWTFYLVFLEVWNGRVFIFLLRAWSWKISFTLQHWIWSPKEKVQDEEKIRTGWLSGCQCLDNK